MIKPYVSLKAILLDGQGRILLLRGAQPNHASYGKWDLPGGRIDAGETPLEGLVRELYEELGLHVSHMQIEEPFFSDVWGVGGDVLNNPVVGVIYLVRLLGTPAITLSFEHSELCWFDPRNTFLPDTIDRTQRAVQAYRSHIGFHISNDTLLKTFEGYGLIQVLTGDGKGKTTSALGDVIRALGAGKRVGIVYFDKGGTTHYSERAVLESLKNLAQYRDLLTVIPTGRDRIDSSTGRFDFSIQEIDKQEARRGLEETQKLFRGTYDVVVLDEINSTCALGIVSVDEVLSLVLDKPQKTELVLTGRNAPQVLIDQAHLVTEMKLRKHYFYSGVKAREGLDY